MSIVLVGSTSGSITLQEPAVAGSTVLSLPATSGTLITTGSSGQSIPKAALPTGSVLQVVQATYSTETSNSTSTYADTGLSASITPTSSSSKILVLISHPNNVKSNANSQNDMSLNLCRNGSQIVQFNNALGYTGTAAYLYFSASFNYLDSPSTTSATTYKTQFKNTDNNGAAVYVQASSLNSTMTLMEIAA